MWEVRLSLDVSLYGHDVHAPSWPQTFRTSQRRCRKLRFSTYLASRYDDDQGTKKERQSNILHRSRNHKATDPRDRVFAFLAMVNSWRLDGKHDPDYTLSTEEVYTRFARLIIVDDGHLQIPSDQSWKGETPSTPSWVPDWRYKPLTMPFSECHYNFPLEYSVNNGFNSEQIVSDGSDPLKLHLRGAEIDIVSSVTNLTPIISEIEANPNLFGRWRLVLSTFRQFFLKQFPSYGSYHFTSEPGTTAFIRTLAADHLPYSEWDNIQVKEMLPCAHGYHEHELEGSADFFDRGSGGFASSFSSFAGKNPC